MGAVIGRERRTVVCLMHRGAWFAADDRSYKAVKFQRCQAWMLSPYSAEASCSHSHQ